MRMKSSLAVGCALALSMPLALSAQEHGESYEAEEHEYLRNHGAALLGATTHLDPEDTGFTIGVEYVRRLTRLLAIGVSVEMASSSLERDIILGLPIILYPWKGLALVAMPGAEAATVEEEHGAEIEEATEAEFLMRLGVAYWFEMNETVGVAPAIFVDHASERWSLVYGMVFGVAW
ncbi:MAG: hypothetical protein AMS21_12655 [Gemmatimonas sp. SG8_38_2]|nr:MAG: hypothetical protein AMS21_12655 [Gemmatimonas sp. SG8_38_2]